VITEMPLDLSVLILSALFVGAVVTVLLWSAYNLIVALKGLANRSARKPGKPRYDADTAPSFSIIVPLKGEEAVLPRLIDHVVHFTYPKSKYEVLLVEDGSHDRTPSLCAKYAEQYPEAIRYLHRDKSDGKPSALNAALRLARGEIIGILDADSVPPDDLLMAASDYFVTRDATAIQGATSSINADENMLTKVISLEETMWFQALLRGKSALDLFVPLTGNCYFVKGSVLRDLGGWDEHSLAEDVDLSLRIIVTGGKTVFAENVRAKQEAPSQIAQFFRQRIRWYRGYMESALSYGKLLKTPSRLKFDAELTLSGPYILSVSLLAYLSSVAMYSFGGQILFRLLALLMTGLTTVTLCALGVSLAFLVKPRRLSNLVWIPFIYAYWSLQSLISAYALGLMVTRRPRVWTVTKKKGTVSGGHKQADQ
jgi:cellulose synthase/poly-beta-1,6-N-acetylglucosamine synthase-like glycosyltransferase